MSFLGELKDKQKPAANKLCARSKMLLAYPQGTGKTVMAIAAAEKLFDLGLAKRAVILCPTNIAWQWEDKLYEFSDSSFIRTSAKAKETRAYKTKVRYQIIPYSVFRKDFKEILANPPDIIIADEAQEFSNYRSKTKQLISRFNAPYRWALTGTAISNKLEELYNIMAWVDKGLLPPWPQFEERHIVRNPHTGQIISYKNLESLNYYLARTRLERKSLSELRGLLPSLSRQIIYVEKDKEVRESEKVLLEAIKTAPDRFSYSFDGVISSALHGARQAVLGKKKLDAATLLIQRILEEHPSNRVVLFSFHKQPLYDLQHLLGGDCILYTGDDSSDEKQRKIREFRESIRVLISSNAGAVGLDLPFANYVINLDVPFSFGTLDQRATRVQRAASQFEKVISIQLLVKGSIEEYYYQVVNNKEALAKAALEGGSEKIEIRPDSLKDYLENVTGKD